jgi:hypothetical protein
MIHKVAKDQPCQHVSRCTARSPLWEPDSDPIQAHCAVKLTALFVLFSRGPCHGDPSLHLSLWPGPPFPASLGRVLPSFQVTTVPSVLGHPRVWLDKYAHTTCTCAESEHVQPHRHQEGPIHNARGCPCACTESTNAMPKVQAAGPTPALFLAGFWIPHISLGAPSGTGAFSQQ